MKESIHSISLCPKCGLQYTGRPAISRADNATQICPDCGTREALDTLGIGHEEQEEILQAIHRSVDQPL